MTIEITENGPVRIVRLQGDFDLYASPAVREKIMPLVSIGEHRVLIDMAGVRYLDSSGIGALIQFIRLSREKKGSLVLTALQPSPIKVLTMSNILPLLTTAENLEAGLTLLNNSKG